MIFLSYDSSLCVAPPTTYQRWSVYPRIHWKQQCVTFKAMSKQKQTRCHFLLGFSWVTHSGEISYLALGMSKQPMEIFEWWRTQVSCRQSELAYLLAICVKHPASGSSSPSHAFWRQSPGQHLNCKLKRDSKPEPPAQLLWYSSPSKMSRQMQQISIIVACLERIC